MKRAAFTLIELLVVITIIVVLLALLVPAMDKALYQAQLSVCGANLKGIGNGVSAYAMSYKRYYPHLPASHDPDVGNYFMRNLTLPTGIHNKKPINYDNRLILREAASIKSFQCPLGGGVDLDASPATTYVYGSYAMWFGAKYRQAQGGQGMLKLGDKIGWDGKRFGYLAGDNFNDLFGFPESPHPDLDGRMPEFTRQDQPENSNLIVTSSDGLMTMGEYGKQQVAPGKLDLNYAGTDGSVLRQAGVEWAKMGTDSMEGMARVPQMPHAIVEPFNWLAIPSR